MNSETISPELPIWYRATSTILSCGALAKIASALYLEWTGLVIDVFLFKSSVLLAIGLYELLLAGFLLSGRVPVIPKLVLGFWTGSAFLATHVFYHVLKIGGCPCLGVLGQSGGMLSRIMNVIIIAAAFYIFLGSLNLFRKELHP